MWGETDLPWALDSGDDDDNESNVPGWQLPWAKAVAGVWVEAGAYANHITHRLLLLVDAP